MARIHTFGSGQSPAHSRLFGESPNPLHRVVEHRSLPHPEALVGLVGDDDGLSQRTAVAGCPWDWIARAEFASAGGPSLTKEQLKVAEYQRDAERGDTIGQYNLGWAHYNGVGIPTNYPVAYRWFVKAAAGGDTSAQDYLGLMYEFGRAVPKDLTQARLWYKKATDGGNDLAETHLISVLLDEKTASSDMQALAYARSSAAKGNDDGLYYLALMFEQGRGVPVNRAEAVRLYKLSAAKGDEDAQRKLKALGY